MRILLDSHVFLWFVLGDPLCKPTARELIGRADVTVFVSAVTSWELATKVRIGKWPEAATIVRDLDEIISDHDFERLPITIKHGRVAGLFPEPHKDPFDRMLAAQAKVEAMTLITADSKLRAFKIDTMW